jgi:hypothetical protein
MKRLANILRMCKAGFTNAFALDIYKTGLKYYSSGYYKNANSINLEQVNSEVKRSDIINFILGFFENPTYLEIGVRNPSDNFDLIKCNTKYGVDPGIEFTLNPVDFIMTSDVFFEKLRSSDILNDTIKFDVIFIDGLHLAEQVERDIENALEYLSENGFVILHDCNPPSEFHATENYDFKLSPSLGAWNGTVWKAFAKMRKRSDLNTCCIDTDWGIGVINKTVKLSAASNVSNPYFEYFIMANQRKISLGLVSYKEFRSLVNDGFSAK